MKTVVNFADFSEETSRKRRLYKSLRDVGWMHPSFEGWLEPVVIGDQR